MRSILAAAALAALLTAALPASADDASDIRATISAQLEAFKSGDAEAAYSHAAPGIRQMFPTADGFMEMVERGYGPVYQSSTPTFGAMTPSGPLFRQEVFLSDPQGRSWVALYVLQRQEDGSMKIVAVQMRPGEDIAT